ncbi:MAG: anion transporter, partial [Saprospiraceae bacterium]|nr:anion transporter [Saprospiraceae bacterium]
MYSFSKYKKVGLLLGPLLFILLQVLPPFIINEEVQNVISVAAWMIVWWLTEPVSISVTALIPLVLFPLFGIMDIKETSGNYGSHIVYLFFGGFVMALALEKVNLHKRIALNIIKRTGTSPDRVVLGFMLATALLSMWISNTASTVVMLPIAIQV